MFSIVYKYCEGTVKRTHLGSEIDHENICLQSLEVVQLFATITMCLLYHALASLKL